jgi:hypothetical protein
MRAIFSIAARACLASLSDTKHSEIVAQQAWTAIVLWC